MDLYQASFGQSEEDEGEVLLTLEEYESTRESLVEIQERGAAAERLAENPDFKMLILEGYLEQEPHRLADLLASGKLPDVVRTACQEQLTAIGNFRNFMKMLVEQGKQSVDDIAALEEAREYALEAEAEAQAKI